MESRKTALEVLNALDQGDKTLDALLNALEKRGLQKGVASLCIGGGEATAIAIERMS